MLEQIFTLTFMTAFLAAAVRMAVPLAYAAMGELIAEKSGILNIGMEGVMLAGAFFSFAGAFFAGSIFLGLVCGILGGVAVSMVHGVLSIHLAKDQSVSGISLNIFALGVTSFLYKLMSSGDTYKQIDPLSRMRIPVLADIPLVGSALFEQDIMTYVLYFLVAGIAWFYAKTSLGLSFAAIGENPRAADAAGIPVHKYQYIAMVLNGILGGVGGAYLVLVQVGNFTENMTSGRGYIALAAVILGRYVPGGILAASFLFGAANALQIRLQAVGVPLPPQALAMLPYVITLAALLTSIGKNQKPEALSRPYVRGAR
ncbi:MAG: ABC transporter permease [Lachnospiraceae bacterium]|nr:ABC transporter permease [Lachnospiraceae bacterium]